MKRLTALINLAKYLKRFNLADTPLKSVFVVDEANASSRLSTASGKQIVIGYPEQKQIGDTDGYTSVLSTAIFVIDKALTLERTDETEFEQFAELAELAADVLSKIENDISQEVEPLLEGLNLVSSEIIPEYSLFGGWNGWSIELLFE